MHAILHISKISQRMQPLLMIKLLHAKIQGEDSDGGINIKSEVAMEHWCDTLIPVGNVRKLRDAGEGSKKVR